MTLLEFLASDLARLHAELERNTADLTPEQWHALPGGTGTRANTIAFAIWHYARTEDNVVRYILQGRPTVWMDGGWAARLGLPDRAQGTGMSTDDAQALRIRDLDAFGQYRQDVWESTRTFLADTDEESLARTLMVRPLGEMPAIRAIGQVCLTHGFQHLGELELARGLVGAPAQGL